MEYFGLGAAIAGAVVIFALLVGMLFGDDL